MKRFLMALAVVIGALTMIGCDDPCKDGQCPPRGQVQVNR